jgi:glycosyltransferase involved in cell wall biosynthesis
VPKFNEGDLVFASGEDSGLPVAILNTIRRRRAVVSIQLMAPAVLRVRVMGWALRVARAVRMDVVRSEEKRQQAGGVFGKGTVPIHLAEDQTDTDFFVPRSNRTDRPRLLVVSSGLEQRDYVTLVDALEGLDVDAKFCAASPNYTDNTSVAIPSSLTSNIEMCRFEFAELRELYQQGDVTVLALLPNSYGAGSTSLLEAVACGSPVVMTTGVGTPLEFIDDDLILGVPPLDVEALRSAIQAALAGSEEAAERAERARARVLSRHSRALYVDGLEAVLIEFESSKVAGTAGAAEN